MLLPAQHMYCLSHLSYRFCSNLILCRYVTMQPFIRLPYHCSYNTSIINTYFKVRHRIDQEQQIQFNSNQIQQQIAPYPILEGHGKKSFISWKLTSLDLLAGSYFAADDC